MAVKKKGDTSAASADTTTMTTTTTTMTTPPQDEAAAVQGTGTNSDNSSIDTITDGQHEVDLLDLGISAEDIAAMRRINALLEELQRAQQ